LINLPLPQNGEEVKIWQSYSVSKAFSSDAGSASAASVGGVILKNW
jgi:hypothetical protein